MKFPTACLKCQIANPGRPTSLQLISVQEESRYEVICEQGHRDAFVLQNPKFDILFEIGAHAILDGYYREAVSSFQASLERCYEFFLRAALKHIALSDDVITEAWKSISKQSERQLGAFVMVYTTEFGRPPALLSNQNVAFRNAVIHQGRIPSWQEAIDYGQAILDLERPLVREVRQRYSKAVTSLTLQNTAKSRKPDDASVGVAALSTIVGFQVEEPDRDSSGKTGRMAYHARPLAIALSELQEQRGYQSATADKER
jgi:hypothetical protein